MGGGGMRKYRGRGMFNVHWLAFGEGYRGLGGWGQVASSDGRC